MCELEDDEEKEAVPVEYEEIVEYIEIDEFGNEIALTGLPIEESVEPPILVIEEDGVEIECIGEENRHEDNPPSDNLDAECTAFVEDETITQNQV